MSRLIWSPSALRDVQRLYRFLAGKNIDAARRAVNTIRESVKIIEGQPGIGRPTKDMEPEYREWLINFGDSGYVVLYRFDGHTAVIVAVRHQREAGY
jgi:plasmid stabilization system protein ParE